MNRTTSHGPRFSNEETTMATATEPPITRQQIEDFLYEEAALLDEWRLEEWLTLLTENAAYYVPSTDVPDGDHRQDLFIVADDMTRIRSRVKQLLGRFAHAEHPHSRTRRLIGNVRIRKIEGERVFITANFIINRIRMEQVDTYIGRYEYILIQREGMLKIHERRAILDLDSLRPQGKVSIIL